MIINPHSNSLEPESLKQGLKITKKHKRIKQSKSIFETIETSE
jgi:hypothetical protein